MLKIEKTEYDLNMLFSFETLKEILLKLARSQIRLEKEIDDIKETIKNREDNIEYEDEKGEEEESYENENLIENKNTYTINYSPSNQEEININNNNEKENIEDNKENNKDNKEINNDNETVEEKKEEKENEKEEEKKEEKKEDKKDEEKKNIKEENKEIKNEIEDKIIEEKNILPKKTDLTETKIKNNEKGQSNNIPSSTKKENIKTNAEIKKTSNKKK